MKDSDNMITIKSKREIDLMKEASLMVSKTHKYLKQFIKPGVTLKQLDAKAYNYIISLGGVPTCKGYEGYPATLCTSVNDTVVHGIPNNYKLKNGDIITIDMVIGYKGYQGDAAWSYAVGDISDEKKYLLEHTCKALYEGVAMVRPGNRIGDISSAIEKYAKEHNLGIVKELCGHGIGLDMHEDPDIPNFGLPNTGVRLKEGMVICIEPMLTYGKRYVYLKDDGWTVKTVDKSPSAHFEHTVLVTHDGFEILTKRLD